MPSKLIGFLQSLGVAIYCSLIALFIWNLDRSFDQSPQVLNMVLMLFLLVFSVAICGTLVFGYPVYLLIGHNVKRALHILAYTMLFSLLMLLVILLIINL